MLRLFNRCSLGAVCLLASMSPGQNGPAQNAGASRAGALASQVDAAVMRCLAADKTPSASIAIVRDGKLAYAQAYGYQRLAPARRASTGTRYQLASISKMFTAQAVLLLASEGRLSLGDPVSRWFPELTKAGEVTVQELLNHTSGYPDHYPQSYPAGPRATAWTPDRIISEWGRHPLLFPPGTQYRYSNLEYQILGRIIEKVSGEGLFLFLERRVFAPAGMTEARDLDLIPKDSAVLATGYVRQALGPLEPAPYEGPGWSFGAGQVVTTATDVAHWDVNFLAGKVLPPGEATEEITRARLANGTQVSAGLGIFIGESDGVTRYYHGGQGLGFEAINLIFPASRTAVVVLTNTSAAATANRIADQLTYLLVPLTAHQLQARAVFQGLQAGQPDETDWTADLKASLDQRSLAIYHTSLARLGPIQSLYSQPEQVTDGLTTRDYEVTAGGKALKLHLLYTPEGQLEDARITPAD